MHTVNFKRKLVASSHLLTMALLVSVMCFACVRPVLAQGLPTEQQRIYDNDIQSFDFIDRQITNSGCGASSGPPGTLPGIIPEPYNGAFTSGANKHKVAPALIAALFTEENFTAIDTAKIAERWVSFPKQHPDPNSGWPTNKFMTMGAFQFIPGTWAAYGDDGNGDGKKDAMNIADAAAGAANYVAANGATTDKPPAQWHDAIFAYNHAEWYVAAVMTYYNFYNSGGTPPATTTVAAPGCAGQTSTCTDGGTAVTGKMALLCEARKFDPFGYKWAGGHEDPEKFMANFNSLGGYTAPFRPVVDCSGLITVAIWNAYHAKVIFSTASVPSLTQDFRKIPIAQAQPGDLVWFYKTETSEGHIEVVAKAGGTATFGAHTSRAAPEKQIGDASPPTSYWMSAFEYIGPGSAGATP